MADGAVAGREEPAEWKIDARTRRVHAQKVERIAEALRRCAPGRPVSLRKKAVSHMVPKLVDTRRHDDKIDVSDLDQILLIDPSAQVCIAEPGVTFVDLVKATLAYGLVPPVVPELETITVGGAVSGASLESMSFRYGGFHDSCTAYEVLTTSGDVLECTPDNEHAPVFEMMHGSFGTLGVLTKLTFRLVPAKPFVHLTYETYGSLSECTAAIRRRMKEPDCDFLDGIFHPGNRYVLSVGRFVEHAPYAHTFDWVKIYYRTTATRTEDYLRTKDYFFRYDRGVTNPTPRSFLGRLLFGKLLDSTTLLRLAEVGHKLFLRGKPEVTLDTFLPLSRLEEFMAWFDATIGHRPLWCVPYRIPRQYPWLADDYLAGVEEPELFVDIAIYGLAQPAGRNYYREIEEALVRLRGVKTLISHNFFDEETFWTVWNKPNYGAAKRVTDARGLMPDLYRKTHGAERGAES